MGADSVIFSFCFGHPCFVNRVMNSPGLYHGQINSGCIVLLFAFVTPDFDIKEQTFSNENSKSLYGQIFLAKFKKRALKGPAVNCIFKIYYKAHGLMMTVKYLSSARAFEKMEHLTQNLSCIMPTNIGFVLFWKFIMTFFNKTMKFIV